MANFAYFMQSFHAIPHNECNYEEIKEVNSQTVYTKCNFSFVCVRFILRTWPWNIVVIKIPERKIHGLHKYNVIESKKKMITGINNFKKKTRREGGGEKEAEVGG